MKKTLKRHQIIVMIACLLISSSTLAASSFVAYFQMNSSPTANAEDLFKTKLARSKNVAEHCADHINDTSSIEQSINEKQIDCSSQCDSRCATLCYVSVMSLLPSPLTLHNPKDKRRYFPSYKKTPLMGNYLDIYHPPI